MVIITCLIHSLILTKHLYSSGMWLGMNPKINTKRYMFKEIGIHAQNMITIMSSAVNIIGESM